MTRKHFEAVAQNFAYQNARIGEFDNQAQADGARYTLLCLAQDMCATFRTINPNFNSAKFMHAAGF